MLKPWYKKLKYLWYVCAAACIAVAVFAVGCFLHLWAPPARFYLFTAYVRQVRGDYQGAIKDCSEAIRLNPKDKRAYHCRAYALTETGDMTGVIKDCDQAIRIDPRDVYAYGTRGYTRESLHQYEQAMSDVQKAIELDPKMAGAYTVRAKLRNRIGDKKGAMADLDQAIRLDPKYGWNYAFRGKLKVDLGDAKGAVDDIEHALKLDPESAWAFASRARARLYLGNRAGALQDFNQIKRIDPKFASWYMGRHYMLALADVHAPCDKISSKALSQADLVYGEKQTTRMLKDRPRMANYVSKGDPVWTWTVRQFAGEGLGARILWNAVAPIDEHVRAYNSGPNDRRSFGLIAIREVDAGKPLSGEDQWSCAVFELYNIRNTKQFDETDKQAFAGKLTKEEFMRKFSTLEFNAGLSETSFYHTTWLPHARKNNLTATDSCWGVEDPATYDEWIACFKDPSGYPYCWYGTFYDQEVVPRLKENLSSRHQQQQHSPPVDRAKQSADLTRADVLAAFYYRHNDNLNAEKYYSQALAIREKALGPDNLDVAVNLNNLAFVYSQEQQYSNALSLLKRAKSIRIKALGPNSAEVDDSLKRMAALYCAMGRKREAAQLQTLLGSSDRDKLPQQQN